jgi:hypothetical protein
MELVTREVEGLHLRIGDFDPLWIRVGVEFAAHGQAGFGRGVGDELDDDEATGQRRKAYSSNSIFASMMPLSE